MLFVGNNELLINNTGEFLKKSKRNFLLIYIVSIVISLTSLLWISLDLRPVHLLPVVVIGAVFSNSTLQHFSKPMLDLFNLFFLIALMLIQLYFFEYRKFEDVLISEYVMFIGYSYLYACTSAYCASLFGWMLVYWRKKDG